ncbi:MAG TPA: DUF3553 domain-containing protein [Aliidongia sp.]|uniref:DUF3553 domain-containing protein n=1 Tax=Aliidongia sp. TaxID=1914230 RepID=UPI002DDCA122|nr:DUF3553 domain-containing protein [Aliidongia sp.]HEV2673412.1 DUF3553 domain-containing protein [Aliidongia sp.]
METNFVPGTWVSLPTEPDWGIGQVQSAIDGRITINFEHAGKRVILADAVELDEVDLDAPG